MRFAKIDANQTEVVKTLRAAGATVQSLATIGNGCPDLLVGYRGVTVLLEVKDGNKAASAQKLTPDQEKWHSNWGGGILAVVNSAEQAMKALGIK